MLGMKTTLDLAKICRFNILNAEWLIAQKHKMHFSIINYQIVSQKRYHNADFQKQIPYHKRKFHLESNKSIKYLSSGTKGSNLCIRYIDLGMQ